MCGLSFEEFWRLTLKQINLYLETMGKKRKRDAEDKRIEIYNSAVITARFVGLTISGHELPSFAEVFPDSDQAKEDDEVRRQQEMAIQRDAWISWAEAQNRKGVRKQDGYTATPG